MLQTYEGVGEKEKVDKSKDTLTAMDQSVSNLTCRSSEHQDEAPRYPPSSLLLEPEKITRSLNLHTIPQSIQTKCDGNRGMHQTESTLPPAHASFLSPSIRKTALPHHLFLRGKFALYFNSDGIFDVEESWDIVNSKVLKIVYQISVSEAKSDYEIWKTTIELDTVPPKKRSNAASEILANIKELIQRRNRLKIFFSFTLSPYEDECTRLQAKNQKRTIQDYCWE